MEQLNIWLLTQTLPNFAFIITISIILCYLYLYLPLYIENVSVFSMQECIFDIAVDSQMMPRMSKKLWLGCVAIGIYAESIISNNNTTNNNIYQTNIVIIKMYVDGRNECTYITGLHTYFMWIAAAITAVYFKILHWYEW